MAFEQGTDVGPSLSYFSGSPAVEERHDVRARQLEATLHRQIPLTRAMDLRVDHFDGRELRVSAPLAPNVNQHTTAFGGSLAATCTLAGWGFLWLLIRDRYPGAKLVIQESSLSYVRPVTDDFCAVCHHPGEKAVRHLFTMLDRKGKGRIDLRSDVHQDGRPAVSFRGRYVVVCARDADADGDTDTDEML